MSALLELAERCEKATGPDLAIDFDVADLVTRAHMATGKAPKYTASLDAAMTLVPETISDHFEIYRPDHQTLGWTVHLMSNANFRRPPISGFAVTLPLALTAAALRASAPKEGVQ